MPIIPLTKNQYAIVDQDDFELLNQLKWYASKGGHGGSFYAMRSFWIAKERKKISMHRFLLNPADDLVIDHINGNGLDNRRKNLRIVTREQNQMNRRIGINNSTGFKGVNYQRYKFVAHICYKKKPMHIGSFETALEAAKAYNAKALELFGEYAQLNEI